MTARRAALAAGLLLALALAGLGLARAAGSGSPDATEQADAVAATLRCPTCQGLSVRDSNSPVAAGARDIIREQVRQGRSADETRAYFVGRYGDFVLLSPPRRGIALAVWVLPLAALAAGATGAAGWAVRRQRLPAAVDDSVLAAAAALLDRQVGGRLVAADDLRADLLHDALAARLALHDDEVADPDAVRAADLRLVRAYQRQQQAASRARPGVPIRSRVLPRRATAAAAAVLLAGGAALALTSAVRTRGADLVSTGNAPTGRAAPPVNVESGAEPGGTPAGAPSRAQAAPAVPDASRALTELLSAVRKNTDDPAAWTALGRAYGGTGQLAGALNAYDRALALRPRADDLLLLRAGVLVRGGSAREALTTSSHSLAAARTSPRSCSCSASPRRR